jgi:plasmid stability protein
VETRNLTLSLPTELIKQAKVYAAQHDTTVNALVRELLKEKVSAAARAERAVHRLLEIAARGPFSDVAPSTIDRDELHERR